MISKFGGYRIYASLSTNSVVTSWCARNPDGADMFSASGHHWKTAFKSRDAWNMRDTWNASRGYLLNDFGGERKPS
jgi:hypothetical protein